MRTATVVTVVAVFIVGVALAAPVPKEAVKLKPATEKERAEVKNHLKMIGLAMHNFESAYGHFPGDIVDAATKKPLLSWRVAILPYMEDHDELYKEFKLDEPWDSDHNKKLIDKLPKVFAPIRVKARAGETFYRGFGGKDEFAGVFPQGQKVGILGITDGTSNTIAVIDAGEPVVWTKPDTDLPCDPKKPLPKFGGMLDGDFHCLMCDGSVRTLKPTTSETVLRALISRAGGEVIAIDDDAP